MLQRIFLLSLLALLPASALGQSAVSAPSEITTVAWAGFKVKFTIRDTGPDTQGNGDAKLDAGESVQIGVAIANLDPVTFPASMLSLYSEVIELAGNQVELPALLPGEGVEFDVPGQLAAQPGTAAAASESALTIWFDDVQSTDRLLTLEYTLFDGTLAPAGATQASGFAWADAPTDSTAAGSLVIETGRLQGEVLNLSSQTPVHIDVYAEPISAASTPLTSVVSDARGRYAIDLLPGSYTLRMRGDKAKPNEQAGLVVRSNLATLFDATLVGESGEAIQEYVVETAADKTRAAVQLVIRKKAAVVSDSVSAQEIARSGDGSASEAVRRAVGTSVVGGKYIYVRGLGERYTYSMVDGVKLPSPEPNKKVVPLDIFPTSVIAGVSVTKTLIADLPGDFAGGAVRIDLRKFPSERVLSMGLSLGFNTYTSFQSMPFYKGDSLDWTGLSAGNRAFPASIPDNAGRLIAGDRISAEDMVKVAREFNNDFVLTTRQGLPKMSGSFNYGDTAHIGTGEFGFLSSLSFGNDFEHVRQTRKNLRLRTDASGKQGLDVGTDFKGEEGTQKANLNALGNFSYAFSPQQTITYTLLYTNKTTISGRYFEGYEQQFNGDLEYTSLRYVQRSLLFNKVGGDHALGEAKLAWHGAASLARRDEPDWRELVRTQAEGSDARLWHVKSSSGSHFWSYLNEPGYSGGVDVTLPFSQWQGLAASVKTGVLASTRRRDFDVRRLRFLPTSDAPEGYAVMPPGELLVDDQVGVRIRLEEASRPTDSYKAGEDVLAGFVMADLPLVGGLRANAGLRYEHAKVFVTTYDPFAATVIPIDANLIRDDFLPSLNLVYALTETMNLRLANSLSVARPDFHELSPFALSDFFSGQEVKGNPKLDETKIINLDLRWEWFPADEEVVALSGFYKRFRDPIEQVIIPSDQQTISYANAKGAHNLGVELEGRKSLGFIAPAVTHFYSGGNVTWLNSRVELDPKAGIQTNNKRPLQGQSDWLFNAYFGYDNHSSLVQLTYNVYSKRIEQAGAFGMPDIYEMPFNSLNFVYTQKAGAHWEFEVSAENMLNETHTSEQGKIVVDSDYEGVDLGLEAKYNF